MEETTIDTPVTTEPAKSSDNQVQEVVTEPAKPSYTDNQEGQTEEVVETPQEVIPYTDEELRIAKDAKTLDAARLAKSYEAKEKAYKELQGEFTKDRQRQSTTPQQRPSDPKQAFAYDVFQAFDQDDYTGITQRMNSLSESIERRKLDLMDIQFTDPDKAAQLKQSILADMDFKGKLDNALAMAYQNKNLNNTLYSEVDAEIFKAMPNFKEVAPDVGKFAMNELKFTQNTIEDTMDAKVYIPGLMQKYGISQQEAAKRAKAYVFQLTKGMHDIYMRMSGKGLKGKENRNPPITETGGTNSKTTNTNLKALYDKATKTSDIEDWAAFYSKEAELSRRK